MEVELEMGLDGVSLTSPASSTVLASNSGACSTASADLDEGQCCPLIVQMN